MQIAAASGRTVRSHIIINACSNSLRRLKSSRPAVLSSRTRNFHNSHNFDVLKVLIERGLVKDVAGDRDVLARRLQAGQVGVYAGIDPTAPSLHLGHLLPLMVLFWLYVHGQHAVSLIGGATAQIGDPSGRLASRARTQRSVEISNTEALYEQVGQLWERAEAYGQRHGYQKLPQWRRSLLNNAEWLTALGIIDFLKQLGSSMRIGAMLSRDTVKNKMEKGDGMSFAEFTYPLLQGWDWWHMYQNHDVQIQVGGSDQYGNIVAGIEAVRHCAGWNADQSPADDRSGNSHAASSPMGITTPLLTTSGGEKLGKSAGNAVWLNPEMTSPFDLYGFLLRTNDEDVEQYLKLFTFVPLSTIATTLERHKAQPGLREAQHLLAYEVSELVHGQQQATSTALRHKSMRELHSAALLNTPTSSSTSADATVTADQRVKLPVSILSGSNFPTLLHAAGLAATKSEGARMIKSGGLYVADFGSSRSMEGDATMKFVHVVGQRPEEIQSIQDHGLLVLRLGKWKVRVIEFVPSTHP